MKKQIWIATLLYLCSTLFLGGVLLFFLHHNLNIFFITIAIFLLALAVGYTLNTYVLSAKFKVDENLLHLTKEILHELNIPLSTIQANTKLLQRTLEENEKGLKRLSRIDDSSKRLKRLYAELVYSIKKEIHTIEKEIFDVQTVVEERVSVFKLLNRNSFILSLSSFKISVDKIGFEKMLDNVLTNAMKYSEKQEPIFITLQDNILSIRDKGIGIDEIELVKIYDRYYQSDNHAYGEGIGLSLVKAYCDDEKIKIRINSNKGEGTTVNFNLNNVII
ncbi:MAG: sensor histidine kinase [Sulfurovum sp.]|nr:MAG: sensor histidine kinase [Sulfurovum sp.]